VRRVLTVLPAVPVPATAGLQLRMLEVLQVVRALGGHSTVLAFQTEEGDAGIEQLNAHCDDAIAGGRRIPYDAFSVGQRVRQRLEFVSNAARRRRGNVYPFSVRYDRMGAMKIVAETIARTKPDSVILPSFLAHYAPAAERAGCGTVIDAPDVLTDISRAFLREYGGRHPIKIPGLLANHLAARSQERLFLSGVDEIWCTSEPEAARLSSISGNRRVIVVPNAIPVSSVSPTPLVDEPIVGFIGTYGYTPNLDAAVELAEEVLPLLRARAPDARVRLAGTGMPVAIEQRLRRTPNVEVLGPVADAAAFVAGCRVMALPVRLRGGVPLKLIEAMAAQRPVVTTNAMVAGLRLVNGRDLLVTDSPSSFAEALHALLADEDLAVTVATAARRMFEEELSTEAIMDRIASSSVLAVDRQRPREA
jgi:glycosyltransferase involved in cell wall biosynthesis